MIIQDVAKNSLWYSDKSAGTANANAGYEARRLLTRQNAAGDVSSDVNVVIPLNRYSFFEELQDKMLVTMQLQFNIELQNYRDKLIHMAHGTNAE